MADVDEAKIQKNLGVWFRIHHTVTLPCPGTFLSKGGHRVNNVRPRPGNNVSSNW
jgi:hypothetical protein